MVAHASGFDFLTGGRCLELSGDRTPEETHALFPPNDTTDQKNLHVPWTTQRLIQFDDLMKKGTGLAIFHYTTHVVNETAQKYFLDWVGGYYKTGYSKVVMDTWTTALASPSHPVLRGVAPLTYTEEIFTNEVLPADRGAPCSLRVSRRAAWNRLSRGWCSGRRRARLRDGGAERIRTWLRRAIAVCW